MIPAISKKVLLGSAVLLAASVPAFLAPSLQVKAAAPAKQVSSAPSTMLLAAALPVTNVATAACMSCHGSTPQHHILGARMGYDLSGHKLNGNSFYANGGGCQKCHTNEGFIEFTLTGKVDDKGFVKYPSQPSCTSCHAPHERGDMSLRTVKPVTLANKKVFDAGTGNLCANCHQARRDGSTAGVATARNAISGTFGPHHGPQADMLLGTNAYEVPGKTYSSSAHYDSIDNSCVSCHMSLPDGRYGFSPALGGHSMNMEADVHENAKLNTSGCVSCHKDMKQAPATTAWAGPLGWKEKPTAFAITAEEDYDQDGTKELVQDEVQGLMNRLVNQQGNGLLQKGPEAFFDAKGDAMTGKDTAQRSAAEVGALYNYKYVLEDRSHGVHNLTYTVQILMDSIAMLDPSFKPTNRPE